MWTWGKGLQRNWDESWSRRGISCTERHVIVPYRYHDTMLSFAHTTHHLILQLLHFSGELLCLSLHLDNVRLSGVGEWSERIKNRKKMNRHYILEGKMNVAQKWSKGNMVEISIQLFHCTTNHLTLQLLYFSGELLSLSLHRLGLSGVGEWSERINNRKKVNRYYILDRREEKCRPEMIQWKHGWDIYTIILLCY